MSSGRRVRYRFADFELLRTEARLLRAGTPVEVQPKVLDALVFFVERPGRLCPKEELLLALWPGEAVTDESLTQVVRKLRRALGDDPQAPRFVATVARRGYRWVGPVERDALPPERAAPAPAPSLLAHRGRWLAFGLAAGLVAAVALQQGLARHDSLAGRFDGAEAKRLTSDPRLEIEPRISPDGAWVVFSASPEPGRDKQLDLWTLPLDVGHAVQVTSTPEDEWGARISPDSREILFVRGEPGGWACELVSVPIFGGPERRLATGVGSADYSPDGAEIAFARRSGAAGGDGVEIVRRRLASGDERVVARFPRLLDFLSWSPDGRRLAFRSRDRLWVVAASGGEPRPVGEASSSGRSVAWAPSGRDLVVDAAWTGGAGVLSLLPLDGSPARPLTRGSGGLHEPSLARDGRRLVYVVEHKSREVWRLDAHGGEARRLEVPTTVEGFGVDALGRRLAWTEWDPPPEGEMLGWVELAAAAAGVRPGRLGDGLCPALSPDGRHLATLGAGGDERGLHLVDLATGDRRRVAADSGPAGTALANLFRCPAFSPDGGTVAWNAVDADGSWVLRSLALASGETRDLAPGAFAPPAFSPDGARLALCPAGDPAQATARTLDLSSGALADTGFPCPFRAAPSWSPAGHLVVLADATTTPALVELDDGGRVLSRLPLAIPADPSFWGVFDLRRVEDGWLVLVERYEGDLYLQEAPAKPRRRATARAAGP